jgi:hypothetical protein
VATGIEGEALLRVADQLCAELGFRDDGDAEVPGASSMLRDRGGWGAGILSAEEDLLVVTIRRSLAKVAAAVERPKREGPPQQAVSAALDGAEMVMRGELVRGNGEKLASLLPDFVFLVTLPMVEQAEALKLSRRAAELLEGQLGR